MAVAAPAPPGCEVRPIPQRGNGLFCTAAPRAMGEQVFVDEPMFVVQHTGNRRVAAVCANCCAFVGPLQIQLEAIFSEARFAPFLASLGEALPYWQAEIDAAGEGAPKSAVRCSQGCGEVYCCEACRAVHFGKCHNLLCTGLVENEDHPLIKFKYHAIEHSDCLLLAAQVLACLINRAKAMGGGAAAMQGLMSEMLHFHHAPFREACRAPTGRGKDAEFLAWTDNLINEAASLLKAAFDIHAPEESGALFASGSAFFAEVMGLMEYNTIDSEVSSPFATFFANKGRALLSSMDTNPNAKAELGFIERLLREKEWVMQCVWGEETTGNYDADMEGGGSDSNSETMSEEMTQLAEARIHNQQVAQNAMDQARAMVDRMSFEQLLQAPWPSFHGAALYVFVARINHSCQPNLKVVFPSNSARLSAVALSQVNPGDELCISYIRQEQNVQTRRKHLLEWYGFVCSCPRCISEDSVAVRKTQKRLK